MKLIKTAAEGPVCYAAEEFIRLAAVVGGEKAETVTVAAMPAAPAGGEILLGTLDELSRPRDDLHDPFIEDIIDIDVARGTGIIAGSNPRSVLMAVYKYFWFAGCRWVRPGDDGEYLPRCGLQALCCAYRKKADYPFRGECCEGAISYEHMRDTVYWMPKVGMNMYMIEGLVPYTYMHKWYGHVGNGLLRRKGQVTDYAMLEGYIARLEQDIARTGVQLHNVGHGWMFEKLGVHHGSPAMEKAALKEADKQYLALVNGRRDLYGSSTFYTQFCYSNPAARKVLTDFVVEYLQKKPWVDFMHLWLADAANNHCECPECAKMIPSDFYVMLLNEIDEALTAAGIGARLVLILYVDLVRPPEKLRLKNPGRFVILAAIGGKYGVTYHREPLTEPVPPYERNRWKQPSNALRLYWYDGWKKLCGNIPGIIYEYRFYRDQYCDLGQMQVARETYDDMRALRDIDFQGCMSDQTHRCYLPTALPMLVMAQTLFDRGTDFNAFAEDYFRSAFGEDGGLVRAWLEEVTALLHPSLLRLETAEESADAASDLETQGLALRGREAGTWVGDDGLAADLEKVPALADGFRPVIGAHLHLENPVQARSWAYLAYYADIVSGMSRVFRAGAEGDLGKARVLLPELEDLLSASEMQIHNVFDRYLFGSWVHVKLKVPNYPYYD